jgi:hypothetical protein
MTNGYFAFPENIHLSRLALLPFVQFAKIPRVLRRGTLITSD